jgi:hypothetical protein
MAGVILGKDATKNARGKRVWLPGGAMRDLQSEVISTCLVPVDREGNVCGAKFVKGQERRARQHALECLARHRDAILEHSAQRYPEIMRPWDPELAAYVKGNQRILSGREPMPRG